MDSNTDYEWVQNNLSRRVIVWSFFLFTTLLYICVVLTSVWPISLLMVYMSPPAVSINVAKVCRDIWNVTFFLYLQP